MFALAILSVGMDESVICELIGCIWWLFEASKVQFAVEFCFLIFVEFWLKFQGIEQQTTFAVCFQIELINRVGILTYLISLSEDYSCEQQVADLNLGSTETQ